MTAHRPRHAGAPTLSPLSRSTRGTATRRGPVARAVAMLEFALILPAFMLMLVFSIDMGHLVLMSGALQDATFTAAQTGAQLGGAGLTAGGAQVCVNGGTCANSSESWKALQDTVSQIPTESTLGVPGSLSMTIGQGALCSTTAGADHVVLTSHLQVRMLTPGLGALMGMLSNGASHVSSGAWTLSATAAARCEVVR